MRYIYGAREILISFTYGHLGINVCAVTSKFPTIQVGLLAGR